MYTTQLLGCQLLFPHRLSAPQNKTKGLLYNKVRSYSSTDTRYKLPSHSDTEIQTRPKVSHFNTFFVCLIPLSISLSLFQYKHHLSCLCCCKQWVRMTNIYRIPKITYELTDLKYYMSVYFPLNVINSCKKAEDQFSCFSSKKWGILNFYLTSFYHDR